MLKTKIREHHAKNLEEKGESKSKMQYYMDGKNKIYLNKRTEYMRKLTRNQVSNIFKARTRMLKVKLNYKNAYREHKCRICGNEDESQKHVLEQCQKLNEITTPITKEMIFSENITEITKTAKLIQERVNALESN